jgi:hypothetical protein
MTVSRVYHQAVVQLNLPTTTAPSVGILGSRRIGPIPPAGSHSWA